jgi:DNA-binding MarR family transcriptional regulator
MSTEERDVAPNLGATLEFMRLLWATDHGFQATSKWMQGNLGVTASQRLVVRLLGQAGEMSPGQLARTLHVHPSTLTGVLQRLQRRGLVRRRAHPLDGRRAILTLSAKGRQLDGTAQGTIEAAVGRALERLTPEGLAQVKQALTVLAEELAKH